MKVLKASKTQYNQLNGYEIGVSKLEFVKDGANNWIVGLDVIHNGNFLEIREQLLELEEIEYIEITVN
jgi:hypothetical protein